MTKEELRRQLDDLEAREIEEYQKAKESAERNNQIIGLDSFGNIRKKYVQLRASVFDEYNKSQKTGGHP